MQNAVFALGSDITFFDTLAPQPSLGRGLNHAPGALAVEGVSIPDPARQSFSGVTMGKHRSR